MQKKKKILISYSQLTSTQYNTQQYDFYLLFWGQISSLAVLLWMKAQAVEFVSRILNTKHSSVNRSLCFYGLKKERPPDVDKEHLDTHRLTERTELMQDSCFLHPHRSSLKQSATLGLCKCSRWSKIIISIHEWLRMKLLRPEENMSADC